MASLYPLCHIGKRLSRAHPDRSDGMTTREDLVRARCASGLSQGQVAALMGKSPSALSRMESGERKFSLQDAKRYAEVVGGKLVLIEPGADDLGALSEEERRCVESYRLADPEHRRVLTRLCSSLSMLDDRTMRHVLLELDAAAGERGDVPAVG